MNRAGHAHNHAQNSSVAGTDCPSWLRARLHGSRAGRLLEPSAPHTLHLFSRHLNIPAHPSNIPLRLCMTPSRSNGACYCTRPAHLRFLWGSNPADGARGQAQHIKTALHRAASPHPSHEHNHGCLAILRWRNSFVIQFRLLQHPTSAGLSNFRTDDPVIAPADPVWKRQLSRLPLSSSPRLPSPRARPCGPLCHPFKCYPPRHCIRRVVRRTLKVCFSCTSR